MLVVGPGVKTGIPILYDNPHELGPDRIVNAVAARERYGAPCIVVDFGTSTNFDAVSRAGEFVGGVLAPGIESSMDALFARAARLVKVDFAAPPAVIGKTTVGRAPVGPRLRLRGPGGRHRGAHARRARRRRQGDRDRRPRRPDRPHSQTIELVDPELTLEGLRLVWELNLTAVAAALGSRRRLTIARSSVVRPSGLTATPSTQGRRSASTRL